MANNKGDNMRRNDFNAFSLQQIAAWGLDDLWKNTEDGHYASLPPIQRGFVWKAEQVETLWDSIAQGFPIGSLLLERWDKEQKGRSYEGADNRTDSPTWQLLDGQQRATSIIKGFQNIWSHSNKDKCEAVSALWVDLSPKGMKKTDRRFLFRLVTKSHPWGYKKEKPSERLSASETYKALNAFRKLYCPEDKNAKPSCKMNPHDFSLRSVFPWDAEAPVPLALLLKAITQTKNGDESSVAKSLRSLLENALPIWKMWSNMSEAEKVKITHFSKVDTELSEPSEHFESLVVMLRNALNNFRIPAPELNLEERNNNESTEDEHHPTFNLFKRVNSGGTLLSNEEIQYSLLKTVWPNAPSIIEGEILKDCQLCQPARVVSLMARLYLMSKNQTSEGKDSNITGLQPALTITQFQNMLKHSQKDFEVFCKVSGKNLVEATWELLVSNEFGLPKVLAARIAGSHPELLLLLMYWHHQLGDNNLSEEQQRRSLGFVTALAWFAQDEKRCIQRLAKELKEESFKDYPIFFNNERFELLLEKDEQGRVLMVQLRSPDEVENAFKLQLRDVLSDFKHESWKKKEFWGLYPIKDLDEDTNSWYPSSDAERFFLHKVFNDPNWSKLLYAQRSWIEEWYGNSFDPTQPKLIQDRNRPWDYDHILPKNWVNNKGIPELIRTWLWAIGNFRAWPLEYNRSKSDGLMIEKDLKDYGLDNRDDVLKASFIQNKCYGKWTDLNTMFGGDSEGNDKPKFWEEQSKDAWLIFIDASLLRTVDIYGEWYKELKIATLMEMP